MSNIKADYHTHTIFSHGRGTVLANAQVAKSKGLKQIAICDHGYGQLAHGIKKNDFPAIKSECDMATTITGVQVLCGVEANILNEKGDVDIDKQDLQYINLLSVGFHKTAFYGPFWKNLKFILGNWWAKVIHHTSSKQMKINTNAYINAINRYPIDIITHLNHDCKVNVYDVALACEKNGTYLEINSKRTHFTKNDIDLILKTNVQFVLGSDAHTPERVGDVALALSTANELGIPLERIVNLHSTIPLKPKANVIITK